MSVVTDFFAATPDELASMAIDWGPMPPPPQPPKAKGGLFGFGRKQPVQDGPLDPRGPTLPTVESTSILTTQLGTLDQFVTGTPYDELEQSGKLHDIVRSSERKDGPVVFPVRRELRDGLANLPESASLKSRASGAKTRRSARLIPRTSRPFAG